MDGPLQIPSGYELVRTTPEFEESSIPVALRSAHKVATGVWALVVVRDGSVDFVFDDDLASRRTLESGDSQPIPPERAHHLVVDGTVRLVIEFYAPIDPSRS